MAMGFMTDDDGRAIARIDNVTDCSAGFALGRAWVSFRDDRGNKIEVHVHRELAQRLHACWAATAPADASDLARTVA